MADLLSRTLRALIWIKGVVGSAVGEGHTVPPLLTSVKTHPLETPF